MKNNEIDIHRLMDNEKSIHDRYGNFIEALVALGYDPQGIQHAALNEHVIAAAFKVPPVIIRMFFSLHLCEEKEKAQLLSMNLETGLLKTILMFPPRIRQALYKRLNDFQKDEYPLKQIVDFVDKAQYRSSIDELYNSVNKDYWAAVSGYLKDTNTTSGTITSGFRSMLMALKIYGPTKGRLNWLERGIIHDFDNKLGIFNAKSLKKDFPEGVKKVENFYKEYTYYEIYDFD
ncbi:MAG: hypothetical protein ACFFER_11440 [Candidatus Thorarchaeota archaeon]